MQEYMRRLQAQKNGSGGQGFEFLAESNRKQPELQDYGFSVLQGQFIDDFEEVSYCRKL